MSDLVRLGNLMADNYWDLDFNIATGCLCGSCWVFRFVDLDGKPVHEADTIAELMKATDRETE